VVARRGRGKKDAGEEDGTTTGHVVQAEEVEFRWVERGRENQR